MDRADLTFNFFVAKTALAAQDPMGGKHSGDLRARRLLHVGARSWDEGRLLSEQHRDATGGLNFQRYRDARRFAGTVRIRTSSSRNGTWPSSRTLRADDSFPRLRKESDSGGPSSSAGSTSCRDAGTGDGVWREGSARAGIGGSDCTCEEKGVATK